MIERRPPPPGDHDFPTNVRLGDAEMAHLRRWFANRRAEPMVCPFCAETLTLDRTLRSHPSYSPGPGDTWSLAVFVDPITTVALRCSHCAYLMEFDLEMIRRQHGRSPEG